MYYAVIECIPYIFIRNYSNESLAKLILLIDNQPILLSLSFRENIYSIGTKDGKIFIYSNSGNDSLSVEKNETHFDYVSSSMIILLSVLLF